MGEEGRTKKKILVVDDEPDIRRLLVDELTMEQYEVSAACCGTEALEKIQLQPDLILLDINMPDIDGYMVCEKIRDYVTCPILFLTARAEEADCIRGLRSGGDDYIVKPFRMEELLERVAAHLRREERRQQKSRVYLEEMLAVDFSGYRILKDGADVGLTKTEFRIVDFLLARKGNVFEKEEIYEKVRGYEGEPDAAIITEHIRRIRKKLGKREDGKEYIETVWGVGYRWIG